MRAGGAGPGARAVWTPLNYIHSCPTRTLCAGRGEGARYTRGVDALKLDTFIWGPARLLATAFGTRAGTLESECVRGRGRYTRGVDAIELYTFIGGPARLLATAFRTHAGTLESQCVRGGPVYALRGRPLIKNIQIRPAATSGYSLPHTRGHIGIPMRAGGKGAGIRAVWTPLN